MKSIASFFVLAGLIACGARGDDPSAGGDWVEVPLEANVFREYPGGYRQDTLLVPLAADSALEVMLAMDEGDAIVYTWEATPLQNPDLFLAEFHGHTHRAEGEQGTVMFYRRETGATESGSLIAPFDGIHGWYYRNDSDGDVVVRITVAGFYEVAPE